MCAGVWVTHILVPVRGENLMGELAVSRTPTKYRADLITFFVFTNERTSTSAPMQHTHTTQHRRHTIPLFIQDEPHSQWPLNVASNDGQAGWASLFFVVRFRDQPRFKETDDQATKRPSAELYTASGCGCAPPVPV